ncbi:hypothetical protein PoB_007494900 [Plakobranchus ocellatus]|uniref:Uncharacterized protein n=1 Tax=Plakobranchus ocellatus TaxID=259542 RepID=A0AAV4DW71_9GAST|nr:hypothetical protein PoB_007494900 [Plakobranchus ocellatus]
MEDRIKPLPKYIAAIRSYPTSPDIRSTGWGKPTVLLMPPPDVASEEFKEVMCRAMESISSISWNVIGKETRKDPILSCIVGAIISGHEPDPALCGECARYVMRCMRRKVSSFTSAR